MAHQAESVTLPHSATPCASVTLSTTLHIVRERVRSSRTARERVRSRPWSKHDTANRKSRAWRQGHLAHLVWHFARIFGMLLWHFAHMFACQVPKMHATHIFGTLHRRLPARRVLCEVHRHYHLSMRQVHWH